MCVYNNIHVLKVILRIYHGHILDQVNCYERLNVNFYCTLLLQLMCLKHCIIFHAQTSKNVKNQVNFINVAFHMM